MIRKIILVSCLVLSYVSISTAADEVFSCIGYEPFWGAEISKDIINLEIYSDKIFSINISNVTGAFGYQEEYIKVYSSYMGPAAIIKKSKCEESPSDEDSAKAYEVFLFTDMGTLYGCCDKKK